MRFKSYTLCGLKGDVLLNREDCIVEKPALEVQMQKSRIQSGFVSF